MMRRDKHVAPKENGGKETYGFSSKNLKVK